MLKVAKISKMIAEAPGVFSIVAHPSESHSQPFYAGQFNMIHAFGIGESAISISGDETTKGPLVHTIASVGPVTQALSQLKAGDNLFYRGPFGTPWNTKDIKDRDILLLAGGIGIAPIRSLLYKLLASENQSWRSLTLLFGARNPKMLLFNKELRKFKDKITLCMTVDTNQPASSFDKNNYHIGALPSLIAANIVNPHNTRCYICGPEIMMKFAILELNANKVMNENIFVSLERNMNCGTGHCGHCQFGPHFLCKDGPTFNFSKISNLFYLSEI